MSDSGSSDNEPWREADPGSDDANSSDEDRDVDILARIQQLAQEDSSEDGGSGDEEGSEDVQDGNNEELDMYFEDVNVGQDSDEEGEEEVQVMEAEEQEQVEEVDEEMEDDGGDDNGGDGEGDGAEDGQQNPADMCFTCRVNNHHPCVHPVPGKNSTKCVRCYLKKRPCSLDTNVRSRNVRKQKLEDARNQGERKALRSEVSANLRRLRAEDTATSDTIFALRTTQEHVMQRLEAAQDLAYLRLLYVYKLQQINDNGDREELNEWFEALDRYNLEGRIRENDMNDNPTAADVAEMAFELDDEE